MELLHNPQLHAYFDIRFETSKPGATGFAVVVNGNRCYFEAHGAGTEVRGKRKGAARPSKILCDDYEDSEEVNNEALRTKYERRFFEVVSFLGDEETNVEFIGTILHKQSLLSGLLKNPAYQGRLYRAVEHHAENEELWREWQKIYCELENPTRVDDAEKFYQANETELLRGAKVLWPEKESYKALRLEILEKGARSFQKEKQNNPMLDEEAVFTEFHWYHEKGDGLVLEDSDTFIPWSELKGSACATLDPATGQVKPAQNKKSDYAVLSTGYVRKGRLLVHDAWCERKPPTTQIARLFELHEKYRYAKVGIETNLYRGLLLPNVLVERKKREEEYKRKIDSERKAMEDQGKRYLEPPDYETKYRIPFYEIENTENKRERIFQLEPKITHGFIVFNRALSHVYLEMLENFPKADHDDGPDGLEMLWKLVNNFYKPSTLSINAMAGR